MARGDELDESDVRETGEKRERAGGREKRVSHSLCFLMWTLAPHLPAGHDVCRPHPTARQGSRQSSF